MHINVHGIHLKITGSELIRNAIAQDFSYFVPISNNNEPVNILLEIKQKKAPISFLPAQRASQVRSEYIIYTDPKNPLAYYVDYHGQAILHVSKSKKIEAQLWCENRHLAHEIAYLFLQSQIGLILDSKGIHRIHACGFTNTKNKTNTLVLIPSGGGKSTLAIALANHPEIQLLSDDSPLITRNGNILPYPLRLAFTEKAKLPKNIEEKTTILKRRKYGTKKLLNITELPFPPSTNLSKELLPVHKIILASRHGSLDKPKLKKCTKTKALQALVRDLIIGVGIPQMTEHMLTKGIQNIPSLIPNAISRTVTVKNLLRNAEVLELELSRDLNANAEILL